jgi:predicted GTPase
MKFESPLTEEQRTKKNKCSIGPTSVGKSSLFNKIFGTNLTEGLGATTKEATVVKEFGDIVYWDAPGINKDFGFYQQRHLGFFQSLDEALILFDRDVDDVHLIINLISKMVPKVIYARTKCDLWKPGMLPIEEQLKIDLAEIQKYDPKAKEVIPIGFGMYDKIKGALKV